MGGEKAAMEMEKEVTAVVGLKRGWEGLAGEEMEDCKMCPEQRC